MNVGYIVVWTGVNGGMELQDKKSGCVLGIGGKTTFAFATEREAKSAIRRTVTKARREKRITMTDAGEFWVQRVRNAERKRLGAPQEGAPE